MHAERQLSKSTENRASVSVEKIHTRMVYGSLVLRCLGAMLCVLKYAGGPSHSAFKINSVIYKALFWKTFPVV